MAELRRKQGTKRIGVAMVARTKGASNPGTVSGTRRRARSAGTSPAAAVTHSRMARGPGPGGGQWRYNGVVGF